MSKFPSLKEQMDVIRNGTVDIIPEEELIAKIERSIKENKALNIKLGCDPSRPDLHIGHSVVLNKLRQFQELGHQAILIIGDFTAMIGDPTGRKKARPQLTFEEAVINGKTYFEQASKILQKDKTTIVYNSEWLSKLSLSDMISILGKFTVQRILERDDFTNRIKDQQEISMHELLYPILQGYDSYAIKADVELGGTDQRFNNLVGRDMQKRYNMEPQVVITMPLLEGTDGSEKMSKSLDNAIGITDAPKDIFGKAMSIPDPLIYKYFQLGTKIDLQELDKIKEQLETNSINPAELKRKLGYELVKLYYDEAKAQQVLDEFNLLFRNKDTDKAPDGTSEIDINVAIPVKQLIFDASLTGSLSESVRMIKQGAVRLNGKQISDNNYMLESSLPEQYTIRVGKTKFLIVNNKIPKEQ